MNRGRHMIVDARVWRNNDALNRQNALKTVTLRILRFFSASSELA